MSDFSLYSSKNYYNLRKNSSSSYNSYHSYNSFGKNKYKRERFNSDGNKLNHKNYNYYNNNNNINNNQEIEIDINKIKYNLIIKHKYSLYDIKKIYDDLRFKKILDIKPKFNNEDEIVDDKIKKIACFNEIKESLNINSESYIPKKYIEINKNIGMKLPKNNPLSGLPKNFNKFDFTPSE
jgi:hypothetical protein